jgi:hypothetical protein
MEDQGKTPKQISDSTKNYAIGLILFALALLVIAAMQ